MFARDGDGLAVEVDAGDEYPISIEPNTLYRSAYLIRSSWRSLVPLYLRGGACQRPACPEEAERCVLSRRVDACCGGQQDKYRHEHRAKDALTDRALRKQSKEGAGRLSASRPRSHIAALSDVPPRTSVHCDKQTRERRVSFGSEPLESKRLRARPERWKKLEKGSARPSASRMEGGVGLSGGEVGTTGEGKEDLHLVTALW